MQQALQTVKRLVADFKAQEAAYLSPSYQESQVRQDFIDKFFTALGWDVTHERQKNPYEQEVHIENKVKMSGSSQRRADYAFFLSPNFRDPKFFVEAKKPSRNLANADDYYQTIRYGWNARTPLAVLTDFEEVHILDCRFKPNIDEALSRKIESFHYSDFAVEEQFARFYYWFSREAVAEGSIEKRAAEMPKPRGKGVQKGLFKGELKAVDEAFLEELDEYRITLAKAFKKANEKLEGEELTEAVQRTIDRLVFIRFLEDKGIEEKAIINLKGQKSAWKAFVSLCKRYEPKYNGLVFKSHRILDNNFFEPAEDKLFAEICEELADPASPYDFDKIPISILGSIYERFLGKVVHCTDKRVKVEEKPEVRKAGGVFYTPEYIVRYIVKETVGKLIEGKTPTEIAPMAFADIACGSGSFLIEVYAQLLDHHVRYYQAHPEKAKADDAFERDGKLQLTLKKKKEILLNNIYGVDIDFQATEVTQLSLFLKMLEDATMMDAHQFGLFKETILPDLKQNIVCGNSLIGTDIKGLFADADVEALRPMNFEDAFPTIMKRSGFDAVVGNPPYVRQEQISNLKSYLQKNYSVYHSAADLYSYFIERGVSITKKGGMFSYIVANKWFRTSYARPLRSWLKKLDIVEIIDFGDLPVFHKATTYPCILRLRKGENSSTLFKASRIDTLDFKDLSDVVNSSAHEVDRLKLDDDGWSLSETNAGQLLLKLRENGIPIHEYVNGKILRGVLTGLNDAFVIDENVRSALVRKHPKASDLIRPFLLGRNVKRYVKPESEQYLIFIPNGWTKKESGTAKDKWKWFCAAYPSIAEHLAQFETEARKRYDQGEYWWELRPCDYYSSFEEPKIIYPNICKQPEFTFDTGGTFTNQKCFIIPVDDKYLLALLNSSVTYYLFKCVLPKLRGGFYEPSLVYFREFPIRLIDFARPEEKAQHEHVVSLVDQMLQAKQKLAAAKTDAEVNRHEHLCSSLDHQIDQAVYELCGLTEEEIKIVEQAE
jgi:type I restriction-modification system DNA methylase subunit